MISQVRLILTMHRDTSEIIILTFYKGIIMTLRCVAMHRKNQSHLQNHIIITLKTMLIMPFKGSRNHGFPTHHDASVNVCLFV